MFDFLTSDKRDFILNHPSLKPLISKGDFNDFAQNVWAFQSDFCSERQPENLRFTGQEIQMIIQESNSSHNFDVGDYVDNDQQLNMTASKIFREAGFEIYWHTSNGIDFNDFRGGDRGYVKGLHNLRQSFIERRLEENNENLFLSFVPTKHILRAIPSAEHSIELMLSSAVIIEKFKDIKRYSLSRDQSFSYEVNYKQDQWGVSDWGNPPTTIIYNIESNYYSRPATIAYPNLIGCWFFFSKAEFIQQRVQTGVKKIEAQRKGLKMLFGRLKKPDEPQVVPVFRDINILEKYWSLRLNEVINNPDNSPSYLVELILQYHHDQPGKRSGDCPHIYIFCSKNLAQEIISYLFSHPETYNRLIRVLVDNSRFPKFRQIFKCLELNTQGVQLIDFTNRVRVSINTPV